MNLDQLKIYAYDLIRSIDANQAQLRQAIAEIDTKELAGEVIRA